MSGFGFTSKNWNLHEWKRSNSTASTASSLSSIPSSTTSVPEISTCLKTCEDTFEKAHFSSEDDFDKICALITDGNEDRVFAALYICDAGCGAVADGSEDERDRESKWKYFKVRCLTDIS